LLGQRGGGGAIVMFLGAAYIVVGAYFWSKGTSPGKQTLGMYVYDKRTGYRLGFWSMAVREVIGKWISGLIFSLGFLWILLDDEEQGRHAKLVSAVVLEGRGAVGPNTLRRLAVSSRGDPWPTSYEPNPTPTCRHPVILPTEEKLGGLRSLSVPQAGYRRGD